MKQFNIYLTEKLKVSTRNTTKHTLFPKTKYELQKMIEDEISKNGWNVFDSKFNVDISDWDVSSVTDMSYMFDHSPLEKNPPKWYK